MDRVNGHSTAGYYHYRCGWTISQEFYEKHFANHTTCPMCNREVRSQDYIFQRQGAQAKPKWWETVLEYFDIFCCLEC